MRSSANPTSNCLFSATEILMLVNSTPTVSDDTHDERELISLVRRCLNDVLVYRFARSQFVVHGDAGVGNKISRLSELE